MRLLIKKFKSILLRKDSLQWQIYKYIFFGGFAVLVDQIVYYGLGLNIIPIFNESDPIVEYLGIGLTPVSEAVQSANLWIVKTVCWLLANTTAYILNRIFVFSYGKHNNFIETLLFYIFALPQFIFIGLTDLLIQYGWEVTYANYTMVFLAAFINFVVRKFIIFKG